jgi:ketosteroid isomerase-like protein
MGGPDLVELARAFVNAVASGASVDAIRAFCALDIVQEEFPNRLLPQGVVRDFAALREAAERGRQLMSAQTYDVVNAIRTGECVALEVIWTGTLAIGFGNLKPGDQMRARFAQFFEFRNGLIWRQRNYDCFDPW